MRTAAALAVVSLFLVPRISAQSASQSDIDRALAAVFPSLVRIEVVTASFANGREIRNEAFGSGTIVSPDGYVVTNHHVAGHARRIVCTLATHEEVPADFVGTDALSDITVVKLHPASPRTFPAARFGDSSRVARGEPVLALGSPLALSQSVTLGIVSNPGMVMPREMAQSVSLDGEDVGSIVRWIGHDAAIYPGNSGGPLVDLGGTVVGVNELSYGLAAAIPSSVVQPVVQALIAHGMVRRATLGLELQPRLVQQDHPGALVAWVERDSPAAHAGVSSGDLVTGIDAHAVDVRFAEQLPIVNQEIAALVPGRAVTLDILHQGTTRRVSVVPAPRGLATGQEKELREWGLVVEDLTASSARDLGRDSIRGARVVSVRGGGPAQQAQPAIDPGDVIVSVEGKPVQTVAGLEGMTRALLGGSGRASALVEVDRREAHRLTVIDLAADARRDDPPLEARKAWLAVSLQALTPPLARRLGLTGRTGVRVTRVMDPAVPLQVGDIIVSVDGTPIQASAPGDEQVFLAMLRAYPPGAKVPLGIVRGGTESPIAVTVREAPRQPSEMRRYEDGDFGFRVREMSDVDLEDPRVAGAGGGLIVDAIEPGGWAALARLQTGDIIVAMDDQPVKDVDGFASRLKAAAGAHVPSVVFRVRRGVRTLFIQLEPSWQ